MKDEAVTAAEIMSLALEPDTDAADEALRQAIGRFPPGRLPALVDAAIRIAARARARDREVVRDNLCIRCRGAWRISAGDGSEWIVSASTPECEHVTKAGQT